MKHRLAVGSWTRSAVLVDRAGRELNADMLKARFLYKNGNLVLSLRGRGSLLIVR